MSEVTRERALDDLRGSVCQGCGGTKGCGKSHCRRCYFLLPKELRTALYRLIGQGYEAAYAESLELLREKRGGKAQGLLPL